MMKDHPLTVTATLGGRERKFLAGTLGTYLAITRHGWGQDEVDLAELVQDIERRQEELREAKEAGKAPPVKVSMGRILQQKMEELWMASLPFEDSTLEDFLMGIPANEMRLINTIWAEIQAVQKSVTEDAEEIDTSGIDTSKKKRGRKSSKTG